MKNLPILFSFVFLLVISSFVIVEETTQNPQQEIIIIQTQQNMQQAIDENARTVTYTFGSSDSAIEVQRKSYWNVVPASEDSKAYIKTDDKGKLIEADLTASKETSWTFGQETLKVPEGARVVFKDGKIEVIGKEGQEIGLTDKTSGTELKSGLTLGKEPVSIENGVVSGKNFQVGDVKVQSGSLSLAKDGYVLGKNSLADWKGLTLGNGQNLFLATSESAYNSHEGSAIFPEDLRLKGKGEGFDVLFNEGNNYAKIQKGDLFLIRSSSVDSNFDLLNRDSEGLIPKMDLKGNFEVAQDSKAFLFEDGKVSLKDSRRFSTSRYLLYHRIDGPWGLVDDIWGNFENNVGLKGDYLPSPIEVDYDKKKLLISNFNQIELSENGKVILTIDSLGYDKSLYREPISRAIEDNYLSFENISRRFNISIVKGTFTDKYPHSENLENIYSRILLKSLSITPKEDLESLKLITISNNNRLAAAEYKSESSSIDLQMHNNWEAITQQSMAFRHEISHMKHDFLLGDEGTLIGRGGEEFIEYLQLKKGYNMITLQETPENDPNKIRFKELDNKYGIFMPLSPDSEFTKKWTEAVGGLGVYRDYRATFGVEREPTIQESIKKGFVRGYGSVNLNEDVATFVQRIVEDPAFFQRNNLLSLDSNPLFKHKIELLHNSGFISDKEYDSVLNPGKYGLK